MILHEKTKTEFDIDFETAPIRKRFYCVCDYCGKEFMRDKKTISQCNKVVSKDSCGAGLCKKTKGEEVQMILFGVKNVGGTEESLEKKKATSKERYGAEYYQQSEKCLEDNREKYGVDFPMQLDAVKQKVKDTRMIHYGVDHHTKSAEYQKGLRERMLDKYGVEHFMMTNEFKDKVKKIMEERYSCHYTQTTEFKEKVKETCLKRYGVEFPMLSEQIKNKVADTCMDRYGVKHFVSSPEFRDKLKSVFQEKYGTNSYFGTNEFKEDMKSLFLDKYGNELYFKTGDFKNKVRETSKKKYGVDHYAKSKEIREKIAKTCMEIYGTPYPSGCFGKAQDEVKQFLNSFGFDFKSNYSILEGKEIDLYDENLKIGIEYCGLFWHNELSPQPRLRNYHYSKYRKCLEHDVRLITIFEDEWVHRKDQCKNFLTSALGRFQKRLYARDCKIEKIGKNQFKEFCEDNHIQKSCRSDVVLGLTNGNSILAVMSMGRHHRKSEDGEIVLNRLCFKGGIQIVGGVSKLLKACSEWAVDNNYKKIVTWSDNRWSNGSVYGQMGFSMEKELRPDYSYVNASKPYTRISKQSCRKKNTDCPADKTEKEWMTEKGFARIWDCGKKRWIKHVTKV